MALLTQNVRLKKADKSHHLLAKLWKGNLDSKDIDGTTDEGPKNCNRPTSFVGLSCFFFL